MSYAIPALRGTEFDLTVVVEHSGKVSRVYHENEFQPSTFQSVVQSFLLGRYTEPIRVMAFNKARRYWRDISKDIAEVVLRSALRKGQQVPEATRGFIEYHLAKAIGAEVSIMRLAGGAFVPTHPQTA